MDMAHGVKDHINTKEVHLIELNETLLFHFDQAIYLELLLNSLVSRFVKLLRECCFRSG